MLCAYNRELISRMLDEDLSPEEQIALREHLPHCAACSALYQSFQALSETLKDQLEEPPERLRETVMAELRRKELGKKNRLSRPVSLILGAAACLALVLGITLSGGLPGLGSSAPAVSGNSVLAGAKNAASVQSARSEAAQAVTEEALYTADEEAAPVPAAGSFAEADAALPVYDLCGRLTLEQLQELLGAPALVDVESLEKLQPLYRLLVDENGAAAAVDFYLLDGALLYSPPDLQSLCLAACTAEELDALLAQ